MWKVETLDSRLANCDLIESVTTIDNKECHVTFFNSSTDKEYKLKLDSSNMKINGDFLYLDFKLKNERVEVIATQIKSNGFINCPDKFKRMWENLHVKNHDYPKGSKLYGA